MIGDNETGVFPQKNADGRPEGGFLGNRDYSRKSPVLPIHTFPVPGEHCDPADTCRETLFFWEKTDTGLPWRPAGPGMEAAFSKNLLKKSGRLIMKAGRFYG